MLSKNTIKRIKALHRKKYRQSEGVFIAEGVRIMEELLNSDMRIRALYYTEEWESRLSKVPETISLKPVNREDMERITTLTSPTPVLAIVEIPQAELSESDLQQHLILALDTIQDPGNMGTILRLANWFNIKTVLCSENTVELYSPKVVQASMGAVAHLRVHYVNLPSLLKKLKPNLPIYGTLLDGHNVYNTKLSDKGIVVMGNEGNGITPEVKQHITQGLYIPKAGTDSNGCVESLNVAMATGIILSEFQREILKHR